MTTTNVYRLPSLTGKDHLFVQDEDDNTTLVRVCKPTTSTTSAHFGIASHLAGWLWDGSTFDDFGKPGGVCSNCDRRSRTTTEGA